MSRGRPRATYADQHEQLAINGRGDWVVLWEPGSTAKKVVRKLRRDGYEAKFMVLDEAQALVAVRSTDAVPEDEAEALRD